MSDKEISGIIENQATLKGKIYAGQSEYEIACSHGFAGTEEEWIQKISARV